jgi:hypothetical protein
LPVPLRTSFDVEIFQLSDPTVPGPNVTLAALPENPLLMQRT